MILLRAVLDFDVSEVANQRSEFLAERICARR